LFAGASLVESWKQPQIQSRLELYQTNLLLHAAQWQPENSEEANLTNARNTLVGETLGSSNTAISRGTKVGSEELHTNSKNCGRNPIPFSNSQTSVRLLYKRHFRLKQQQLLQQLPSYND